MLSWLLHLSSADNFTVGQNAAVQIWTYLQMFNAGIKLSDFQGANETFLSPTPLDFLCWLLIISTSNNREKNFKPRKSFRGDRLKTMGTPLKKNLYAKQKKFAVKVEPFEIAIYWD